MRQRLISSFIVLLVVNALFAWSLSVRADFAVRDVKASVAEERLSFSLDLDLELSDAAEEAVDRGIPVIIALQAEFRRDRQLIWSERIVSWRRDVEIRYHALSERYLVQETGRGNIRSFVTIADAMRAIGQGRTIVIPVPALPTNPALRYELEVKAKLDIEALPTPLRLMAYLSPGWRLSTGSTKWPVQH